MTDQLEQDIRYVVYINTGPLDRDEVGMLLLGLLDRIQTLEAKLREKNGGAA
jgi:hypothetical protein